MEPSREEKDITTFSWHLFLFVTGFSFFLFSMAIKIAEGQHIKFFLYAGVVSFLAGVLVWLGSKS